MYSGEGFNLLNKILNSVINYTWRDLHDAHVQVVEFDIAKISGGGNSAAFRLTITYTMHLFKQIIRP